MTTPSPSALQEDIPLATYTTLQLGGPARYFAQPEDLDSLRQCLRWAKLQQQPQWFLGGGSNVVIADKGLPGLVVRYRAKAYRKLASTGTGHVELYADAGADWDEFVAWTVTQGWAGLECLSGIPGCVGAAPIQNIGAYGVELHESFVYADVLDTQTLALEKWTESDCQFSYRHSAFKSLPTGQKLILGVCLRLRTDRQATLRYPELQRTLAERSTGTAPTLQEVRDVVLALRRRKSMVLDPQDPNSRSAGSFFTNPIVTQKIADRAEQQLRQFNPSLPSMPRYPAGDGNFKLSAAWLIDRSGLHKGFGCGEVGLSEKHTLALINRGQATATALLAFARFVQRFVAARTGVQLQPEPQLLGFGNATLQDFDPHIPTPLLQDLQKTETSPKN